MAHDYRNPSEYQPYNEPLDTRIPTSSYYPANSSKPKSRQSSTDRSEARSTERTKYTQPHQPIDEAVQNAASDKVPDNPTLNTNPELIAHITEQVIKQLRTTSVDSGTPIQATHLPYQPPPPSQQPPQQSPTSQTGFTVPLRNIYTPPPLQKHSDYPDHGSPEQPSNIPRGSPPSPEEPPASHFDHGRSASLASVVSEAGTAGTRPKGPMRLSTSNEETTLERIWGPLFDEDGRPTPRLSQFLRGLAVHIIEDYEPLHSIVITPQKMQAYYADVKLPTEIYPWSDVFDDDSSEIGRMYRALECQHHLVQAKVHLKPDIPALTPVGFEKWVTLLIQAHPTEEFERLKKAVLEMPISNPDDKKERFPKDISRRLFPKDENLQIRERVQKAMVEHAQIKLPKQSTSEPSRSAQAEPTRPQREEGRPPVNPIIIPSHIERERKPYSGIPNESAIDDTNPPGQPIERERKPYRVAPGGGRIYEDDGRITMPHNSQRSNSTTERVRPTPISATQGPRTGGLPVPEIHQTHRGPTQRRRHSPSFSAGQNDFRRSGDDLSRGSYQPSNYQPSSMSQSEMYDEDPRFVSRDPEYGRAEYLRRQAEEDASRYGASPSTRLRAYDPRVDGGDPRRGSNQTDEDYYRVRNAGYEYPPGYNGPVYRG